MSAIIRGIKRDLFIFGAPGLLGGAATKIRDLLALLFEEFSITVVVSHPSLLKDKFVVKICGQYRVRVILRSEIPKNCSGVALGICELDMFGGNLLSKIRDSGLKFVWSNEMMWPFQGEQEVSSLGLIDRVLYVSELQKAALREINCNIDSRIVGNYVSTDAFPYRMERGNIFNVGRLSRADKVKYPMHFPFAYESIKLRNVRFRIQAWSQELAKMFGWHNFDSRWQFQNPNQQSAAEFLSGLHVFFYPLGHIFTESWGRSTVEAMLTGAVPVVPAGHNFRDFIPSQEFGCVYENLGEAIEYIETLYHDGVRRRCVSKASSMFARDFCAIGRHKEIWIEALSV